MKFKRRIFGVIAVCLLFAVMAFAVLADSTSTDTEGTEKQYTGTVDEAKGKLSSLDSAATLWDKVDVLNELVAYLEEVDPNAEGRAELESSLDVKEREVMDALSSEAESAADVLSLGRALRELSAFIKNHPIEDKDAVLSAEAVRDSLKIRFESEKAALLGELEKKSYVKDYSGAVYVNNNFDDVKIGGFTAENNMDSSTVLSYIGEDSGMDADNVYYTVRYDCVGKHLRATSYLQNIEDSLVFEFDLTTFDSFSHRNVTFEDYATKNDVTWNVVYLGFSPEGNLIRKGEVLAERVITPGEWTHISVAVDTVTSNVDIYVDYQLVHSFSAAHPTLNYSFTPTMMRIGNSVSEAGGSFSLDNVKIYKGHSPRDLGAYDELTNKERFVFSVSQIDNSSLPAAARYGYYTAAEKTLPNYYLDGKYLDGDIAVIDAVDTLLSFDKSALISEAGRSNLLTLSSYVDILSSYSPNEENNSDRAYWVTECETFLSSIGGLIEMSEEYDRLVMVIEEARMGIAAEEIAKEFNSAVTSFFTASTVDKKQSLYNTAVALLPSLDLEYLLSGGFTTFEYNYVRVGEMKELLDDSVALNNSKLFLAVIAYVSMYETEEEWEANYEYIDTYITIARGIISEGNYDAYYGSMEEYMPIYESINAYFYSRLQQKHLEYIAGEFERYDKSDIYFEKWGIIAKLEQYMTEEEIDYGNPAFAEYRSRIHGAYSELESKKDEYEALLDANTEVFIERAKALSGTIGYTDMKRICDELAVYIHMMNVGEPEARDAITVYSLRQNEIRRIEDGARTFIESVMMIESAESTLEGILISNGYLENIETSVDGVADAIAEYERICREYDEGIAGDSADMLDLSLAAAYICNYTGFESLITLAVKSITD